VTATLFLFAVGLLLALPPDVAAQTKQEKPAAVVGDEVIYGKDFLPPIEAQAYKIRRQEYDLQLRALEGIINQKLLRKEAQRSGMSEEDWLQQAVGTNVPEPTQEEVDRRFVEQMLQGGGAAQSPESVREQLKQEAVEAAREEVFRQLRQQAGVKIYLLPPALQVDYDPARVRGNPDAAITIVEFSDFQCPYCERAYAMVKDLLRKYEGKVKLAYRDLPLVEIRSDIQGTAEAARCAGEQGQFWAYHDVLFENQDEYGEEAFRQFAAGLGLNVDQFAACMEIGKFKPLIEADFKEGIRLGATGTPAFFINGIPLIGARPQAEFEELIGTLLATLDQ
jgi:protein-disulfide isomerase